MNTKLTVALALGTGLIGGLLARYVAPPVAMAQNQTAVTREIRAQSFTLVDSSGRTVCTFTSEAGPRGLVPDPQQLLNRSQPKVIVLRDAEGRAIWTADGSSVHPIGQE